jgi:hypothetical protein
MMTNYQGYLVDTSGNPLNATVTMTFALYDIPEGGTPLWTETYPDVVVTKGIFSVVLGSMVNFTAADIEGERYLGVTVGTDEEMLPRHALTSTLSSIWAGVAESVTDGAVGTENIAESAVTSGKVANDAVTTEKIADKAVTGAKIADLSGHSATELDDITSVGSGAIITTEEREKLKSLTSSVPSTVAHLTVEEQLEVGDKIKVGKNSLWLGTHDTKRDNSIWTTPSNNGKNQLAVQSYGNDGDTVINASSAGNLGVGTNAPQEKLHVDGTVFLEPSIPPFPITDNRLYNQGGDLYWGGDKVAIVNDIGGITEDDPQVGNNTPNYVPKWDGSALVSGTIYDEDGKVGIGISSTPNEKLHVNGAIFLDHTSPPTDTRYRLYNNNGALYWDGSPLGGTILDETDPTVPSDLKDGVSWTEVTDKPAIISSETDPTIPTNLKDGVSWTEVTDKPAIISTEDDPQVGNNTPNYVSKWDGNALVSSTIYDEDGKVGIGISSTPNEKLHVNGAIFLDHTSQPIDIRYRLYNNNGDLYWDGSRIIPDETDPTIPTNLKDGVSWTEVTDKPAIISSETDPTVPANLKNGVSWSEVTDKPTIISTETDPTVPANLKDGVSWTEVANKPAIISSEDDPQVGNNSLNYVPRWDGNALVKGTIYDDPNSGIITVNGLAVSRAHIFSPGVDGNLAFTVGSKGGSIFFRKALSEHPIDPYKDLMRITSEGDVVVGTPQFPGRLGAYGDLIVSGNVGIGTVVPKAKLDVNGDLNVDNGHLYISRGHLFNPNGSLVLNAGPQMDGGIWFRRGKNSNFPIEYENLMRVMPDGRVAIGQEAMANPSGKLDVRGDTYSYSFKTHSDKRWKKNITPLENSLEKVSKLQGVNYQWDTEKYPEMEFNEEKQVGFIAQDVESVIPELVSTNSNGYKSVAYDKMTAVLVEAVKELKAQNDALKAIICEDHPEKAICQ